MRRKFVLLVLIFLCASCNGACKLNEYAKGYIICSIKDTADKGALCHDTTTGKLLTPLQYFEKYKPRKAKNIVFIDYKITKNPGWDEIFIIYYQ